MAVDPRLNLVRVETERAERMRAARPHLTGVPAGPAILIREATIADNPALALLCELDSQPPATGAWLVGELGGRTVAALALDGDRVMADPFTLTGDVLDLLRLRAAQLRGRGSRRTRRRLARALLAGG
jgi:hypothetical protein